MRKSYLGIISAAVLLLSVFIGCGKGGSTSETAAIDSARLEMFSQVPEIMASTDNPITPEKVALGRMLYFETRLSKSQEISCNSCHGLDTYGVDGQPTSKGHKGQRGNRNAPTVYNAAGHFVQFWDGRAANVEEQAKGPVMNPVEMAMGSDGDIVAVLTSMPEYVEAFKTAFPGEKDPVTVDNMALAIGAFERGLVTPTRWDKFIGGDQAALSADEKAGFIAFTDAGCQTCHAGALVGGNMYQRLGMVKAWPDPSDPGREKVTGSEADRLVFKVPSLRNIARTGPYYHNGNVATLAEAVSTMGEYQLGKTLSQSDVNSIMTWLEALTGEVPADYVKKPALPPSTSTTPKPDIMN